MLRRFKHAHIMAIASGKEQFKFDNNEYLVSYAKYLIEYLESQLGKPS